MARKLPLCAFCGEKLTTSGRLTLEWCDIPGKPYVGWCASKEAHHWEDDSAFSRLHKKGEQLEATVERVVSVMKEINLRGKGRLVVTRKWKKVTDV